jgi:hypothetical protein
MPSDISFERSLGIPLHLKKKVTSGCALSGSRYAKPYALKCGQGKTKIHLFRDFFTKIVYVQLVHLIPVKVLTLYTYTVVIK